MTESKHTPKPPLCQGCGDGLGQYHSLRDGLCRECERNWFSERVNGLKTVLGEIYVKADDSLCCRDDGMDNALRWILQESRKALAEGK